MLGFGQGRSVAATAARLGAATCVVRLGIAQESFWVTKSLGGWSNKQTHLCQTSLWAEVQETTRRNCAHFGRVPEASVRRNQLKLL